MPERAAWLNSAVVASAPSTMVTSSSGFELCGQYPASMLMSSRSRRWPAAVAIHSGAQSPAESRQDIG